MLKHHREADQQKQPMDTARREKEQAAIDKLKAKSQKAQTME
jgi:hypothetical protein